MIKNINHKQYNTATSEFIDKISGGVQGTGDYWEESLYRKQSGELYLFVTGERNTKHAKTTKYGKQAGRNIIKMTYSEAEEWTKNNLSHEKYLELFDPDINEEGYKIVTLRLPKGVFNMLRQKTAKNGTTMAKEITKLIKDKWETNK